MKSLKSIPKREIFFKFEFIFLKKKTQKIYREKIIMDAVGAVAVVSLECLYSAKKKSGIQYFLNEDGKHFEK